MKRFSLKCSLFFVILVMLKTDPLQAQRRAANNLYKLLGYKTSIPKFQANDDVSLKDMQRIANSYRLNHETENAQFWYEQVVAESSDAIDFLHYAQALQNNGELEKAKEYYLKYDEMLGGDANDRRGELLANAIDRMNEFQHTDVIVKNEHILNTEKLDFSPSYYKDGLIFVSSRGAQINDKSSKDIWIDDNFMALFKSDFTEEGELLDPELFSVNLTTKYHEGPVVFSRDGNTIFFTRNDYKRRNRRNNSKGIMKLQIYTSTREGDDWSKPESLPFNTKEYEEAHPAISPDGKTLIFSSDRDGGSGGMDLYMSKFLGGKWSAPVNLGENINTAGNEVFPYIHDDGTMYFASNGWGGLGGLDMFSTKIQEDETWEEIENIGTPFNSPMDDFGLIMNVLGTEGYFTSARDNGHGQDDIYSFKRAGAGLMEAVVCTYDKGDNERIEGTEVTVVERSETGDLDTDDLILKLLETEVEDEYLLRFKKDALRAANKDKVQYYTDEDGEFKISLRPNREYIFIAEKDGYIIASDTLSTYGKSANEVNFLDFCIPLEAPKCLDLVGVVKNKKYGNIIPMADVTMVNLCTGEEIIVKSDKDGKFDFPCLDCDCEYSFKGEKKYFIEGYNMASTMGLECDKGGLVDTEVLLELTPVNPHNPSPSPAPPIASAAPIAPAPPSPNPTYPGSNPTYSSPTPTPYTPSTPYTQPPPATNFAGLTLELQNIFYDFDQYYIRDGDAKRDLDKVVSLMQRFSSMTIELGSHTDARGTMTYNERLSQNRANAAVDYIVSKGISRSRLTARGYGETQLRNECANFVECTEEEHQFNRRTEVKILTFNEPGVQVRTIDNRPEIIDPADPNRSWIWN